MTIELNWLRLDALSFCPENGSLSTRRVDAAIAIMRILFIVSFLIAIAGGWLYWSARTPSVDHSQSSLQPNVNQNLDVVQSDGTIIKPDGTIIRPVQNINAVIIEPTPTNTAPTTAARYLDYSASTFDSAKEALGSAPGKLVIYFHVDWSSVCQELDPDIARSLDELPDDLTILKADFEKETALRQQYGIIHEHSFLQVDAAGEKVTSWLGSSNAGDIPSHLK